MLHLSEFFKIISERLSPSELRMFTSLLEDFRLQRIQHTDLVASLHFLFKKDEYLHRCFTQLSHSDQQEQADVDGETQEDEQDTNLEQAHNLHGDLKIEPAYANHLYITAAIEYPPPIHGYPKIQPDLEDLDITGFFGQINSDGPIERSLTSKGSEQVTRSYTLILPEEQQSQVSNTVLNNQVVLRKVAMSQRQRGLSGYEKAMANCEDDMYKTDHFIELLRNAVERAEKVINGEMRIENVGEMFYTSFKQIYRDKNKVKKMKEKVKQNHQQVLPQILPLLQHKLNELALARETKKSSWKQVLEKASAKQRQSTAQGRTNK